MRRGIGFLFIFLSYTFLLTQINIALHNQKQQLTGNPIKRMRVAGRCTGKIIEIQS